MQEYERMGTIFRIFKSDVKGLWRNKLALLIALAICVLPSLYAWFNIYSNWDPYSNTGTIPVAVVSVDKGYTRSDGEFEIMGDAGENFSESMYGFADNDLVHPSVTYYENEKKNPIASKITDTAKGTLQTSINEEFVNVAVSTVMESMNELADDAQKTQYITKIIDKLDSVNKNLDD